MWNWNNEKQFARYHASVERFHEIESNDFTSSSIADIKYSPSSCSKAITMQCDLKAREVPRIGQSDINNRFGHFSVEF